MDMRADQERRFCAFVQNQREDRELFRSWMDREVRAGESPTAPAPPTHMPVQKMGPQDDPEAFLDLFEKTAAACGWPQMDWPVRLIPLLTGEAQLAAQQLPVQNLLVYDDLKRAILQRVGRSPEQHRQRFRSLELGENGRPFVMAHQLRDACRRWLLAGEGGVDQIIDRVVLEQFIARLPTKTAQWVQCHRPASLDLAIQLAEDQMVACHGVGETLPSVSLSLPSPSFSPPTFLPRSRAGVVPRAQPRRAPESTAARAHAREAGSAAAIPVPPVSPRQFLVPLPATRVAGKPGPACWRCGDPGHFIDRCPVMEVGTLVRVPDAPQAAPDQAGGYQIPVSIKGGTYWALVDSGCNQTSIHQSLVQPEALDMSCMVRVRCVHGACRECQLVNPPASPKAPLRPLPLMQVPFERIGMDLIGPLERSARGHRFALVLVDYATRYPEAVALRNISAKSVAEALFSMISRVGIPKEILTDQGTAFMSRTIRELYGLLGIKSVRTSVYHPQTDGLVERFNRTLKTMIRKFVHEDALRCAVRIALCARSRKPPRGFPPSSSCTAASPAGFWTSWGRLGRRDLRRVKMKFSMCWTWEQNSTLWGSSPWRICYRPRTSKAGYTIGGPDYAISHREIKCLCYSPPLALLNYSPSGKGRSRSHGG